MIFIKEGEADATAAGTKVSLYPDALEPPLTLPASTSFTAK